MDTTIKEAEPTAHSASPVGSCWYVVQTAPKNERRVQMALERLGYATMVLLIEVKIGPRYSALRNLISPYMLVRFDLLRDAWAEIREIEGVNRIVGSNEESPVSVPDDVIAPLAMACALDLYDVDRTVLAKKVRRSKKPRNHRRLKRASHRLKRWLRSGIARGH